MPSLNQRRAELAERNNMAQMNLAQNTLVPFGGDMQSETDAVILQQQGLRRTLDVDALSDEITNETGRGLDMLAYYPIIEYAFWRALPPHIHTDRQLNPLLYHALTSNVALTPNYGSIDNNKAIFETAFAVPSDDGETPAATPAGMTTEEAETELVRINAKQYEKAYYDALSGNEAAQEAAVATLVEKGGKPDDIERIRAVYNKLKETAFGRRRKYRKSRFGSIAVENAEEAVQALYVADGGRKYSFVPMVFKEILVSDGEGDSETYNTPDNMNKMKGTIKLDERVSAQLSIAAAVVVNQILESVPSHEITDPSKHYGSTRVIFFEDVVRHIQEHFGNIITLDPLSGDAFETMSPGEVNNFSRSLLTKFVKAKNTTASGANFSATMYKLNNQAEIVGELDEPEGGDGDKDMPCYVFKNGPGYAEMFGIYKSRVKAMLGVKAANVGKVWASKGADDNEAKYMTNLAYMCTERILEGNANMAYGTKFKIDDIEEDTAQRAVTSILTLVALHIITYSLAYSIDAYLRLAIRGADRVNGVIEFKAEQSEEGANVITPQMVFPGVKAALEMYNVDARSWDSKVAFYLRTNPKLLELFLAAKKMYDIDNSKPAVKGFMNAEMVNPLWMESRASQAKYSNYYNQMKGRMNPLTDAEEESNYKGARNSTKYSDLEGDVKNITDMMETLRNSGAAASDLDRLVNRSVVSGFGRRHRRRKSSFGKKKGSKKAKRHSASSFGKRRRRKSSFGKKKKGSKKMSFGKKRRHSKKH
jgi:hypothetical protein